MTRLVQVEVLRRYPRDGLFYDPGDRISIPDYAVAGATEGSGPFVRVLDPAEIVLDADFDATEGALDLARALEAEYGFDLAAYAGQGSGEGGRIHEPDVERWAWEQGLLQESEAPTEG